jgi:hypothetical protein
MVRRIKASGKFGIQRIGDIYYLKTAMKISYIGVISGDENPQSQSRGIMAPDKCRICGLRDVYNLKSTIPYSQVGVIAGNINFAPPALRIKLTDQYRANWIGDVKNYQPVCDCTVGIIADHLHIICT